MGDKSARGPIFPATCAQCGGMVSGPVSFCPHCGTHARLAFGDHAPTKKPDAATASATASAAGARAGVPHGVPLWPRPVPLFASADPDPYGDVRPPSLGGVRHWGVKTGTTLTLLAFVVLCGGAVLLHRYVDSATREQQATSSTVFGSVTKDGMSQPNQGPTTAQSPTTIAAVAPATIASSAAPATAASSVASAQPVVPAVPDRTAHQKDGSVGSVAVSEPAPPPTVVSRPSQPSFSRSQNEKASSPNSTASDKGDRDKNHRLMSLALARAHGGLEKNDLAAARSGIYWALSLQPNNSEALALKQDLLSREKARNAALHSARAGSGKAAKPPGGFAPGQPDAPIPVQQ
jgi:hypothetical protein